MRANKQPLITEEQPWLARYDEYTEKVLGLSPATRRKYLLFAGQLLKAISKHGKVQWSRLSPDVIASFVKKDIERRTGTGAQATTSAVRCFLRFLLSQGVIQQRMLNAVPSLRCSKQARLPKHLKDADVQKLFAIIRQETPVGRRNFAILLILSELGLRAAEVAAMQLDDIDWTNGRLLIRAGKTRYERALPLMQDIGEALLAYLAYAHENGRAGAFNSAA